MGLTLQDTNIHVDSTGLHAQVLYITPCKLDYISFSFQKKDERAIIIRYFIIAH